MKTAAFNRWAAQVNQLSAQQREQLLALIRPTIDLDRVNTVIGQSVALPPCCAHCGAAGSYRHGHHRGLQRYRCRVCRKTFTALTGTPMSFL